MMLKLYVQRKIVTDMLDISVPHNIMTVLNKYRDGIPLDAINIMRPHKLGNPFKIGIDGDRKKVLYKYCYECNCNKWVCAALTRLTK